LAITEFGDGAGNFGYGSAKAIAAVLTIRRISQVAMQRAAFLLLRCRPARNALCARRFGRWRPQRKGAKVVAAQ
jgi:hypothetical protein